MITHDTLHVLNSFHRASLVHQNCELWWVSVLKGKARALDVKTLVDSIVNLGLFAIED